MEGEYHHTPHRGLAGVTPLEQWAQSAEQVRFPEPGLDLDDLFLFEAQRKVQKDRTVSLNGVVYEVDAALIGETVTLRFDPTAAPERPVQVCHQGRPIELARPVQTYTNCFGATRGRTRIYQGNLRSGVLPPVPYRAVRWGQPRGAKRSGHCSLRLISGQPIREERLRLPASRRSGAGVEGYGQQM